MQTIFRNIWPFLAACPGRIRSQKNIATVYWCWFLVIFSGSLVKIMMPIFLAFHFGGEQNAGFLIAALALIQMLFLQPLAGRIFDQKGLIFAFKIGLAFEIFAGLIFFLFQSKWALLFFLFGYLARASFFIMEPFLLRNINPKKSGFFFGLSQEVVAAAHFLGLLAFPFFLREGNEIFLPLFSVFFAAVSFFFLREVAEKKNLWQPHFKWISFDFLRVCRAGLHFVRKNHQYPEFCIGSALFHGFFYGAIWFLLPLHLAHLVAGGGLEIKIYEVATLLCALGCGLAADRFDWRRIEKYAWGGMLLCVWILPFWHSSSGLILLGFFIGLANNFFFSASNAVLTRFDRDHAEDGGFSEFSKILSTGGRLVSTMVCGVLYFHFGLQQSLYFVAAVVSIIAIWMFFLLRKF